MQITAFHFQLIVLLVAPLSLVAAPLLEHDVLPVLQKNCMGCHGGLKQKGGLDLRTVPAMLKGGESGPAVVSGKPEQSVLWKQIAADEMPKTEKKLSAEERRIIKEWIAAGLPTVAQQKSAAEKPLLPAGKKHEPKSVAKAIDEHLLARLALEKLKPAPLADDAEFLRRVSLDLTGRVPKPEQAAAFLDDAAPDKRAKLIDSLLAAPEFGEHFGRMWRDWICPPELPSDMNGGKQPHGEARSLGTWFAARFNAGDAWDKIVRDLLLVKGDIKDQPHLIFYGLLGQDAKITPEGAARGVASLFMGVQLQCAQCHDDPYRDWAQSEFWSLAGFFGNVKGDFRKVEEATGTAQIIIPKSAFKRAGTAVPVAFLGGESKSPQGNSLLRPALVEWMTQRDNPFFARAFANRVWFQFFARGIVNPVDDLRALNPPTHPGLLQLLSNEFAASNFDVKHLVRSICNSQAYQRSSRLAAGTTAGHATQQAAFHGRAPVRVMTADMLLDSLKLAYGDPKLDLRALDKRDGNTSGESAAVGDEYLEFCRKFGTNEEDATDFTHGIPQMLTFLNHPRLQTGSKALDEFRKKNPAATTEQIVEWLYLATLSRRPTRAEMVEATTYTTAASEPSVAYSDILWMLVNRTEFLCVR